MKQRKPDSHLHLNTHFLPSIWCHLPSAQETSLSFPCSAGLLVTNSVFTKIALPSFLKDIFTGYRTLDWLGFVLLLNFCKDFVFPLSSDGHCFQWEQPLLILSSLIFVSFNCDLFVRYGFLYLFFLEFTELTGPVYS